MCSIDVLDTSQWGLASFQYITRYELVSTADISYEKF